MSRLTVTLWRCGRCRKPRGLHHTCTGGRKRRDRLKFDLSFNCPKCGKPAPNPLTHTCAVRSDFAKRKAAQKRAEQAERRKQKRKAAAARKRARAKERKRLAAEKRKQAAADAAAKRKARARQQSHDKNRHPYETCRDDYCTKYGCRVYREGKAAGYVAGHAAGFGEGYAAGYGTGYAEGFAAGTAAAS